MPIKILFCAFFHCIKLLCKIEIIQILVFLSQSSVNILEEEEVFRESKW